MSLSAPDAQTGAAALALALVDAEAPTPTALQPARLLELAWALKDICYGAWSSDPRRAARAAHVLHALCDAATGAQVTGPAEREAQGLALWTAGIAAITRGEMADAVGSFDAAATVFAGLALAGPAAQTQVPKIMALSMQGQYEAAATCAAQAHSAFIALGDTHAAAKVSLNLGALHERRGAYADAARESRSAAVLFARVGDHEHSVMADINMANALTSLGDFDEALRIYARARMRAETHGFPVLDALGAEAAALLKLARGNYRDALAGLEFARRRYESLELPQHLAIAEKQLADAYLELRLLPEALQLFDQVVARFTALGIADELAWSLAQRGRVLTLLARPDEAARSFASAGAAFAAQNNPVGSAAIALAQAELALAADDAAAAAMFAALSAEGFEVAGVPEGRCRAAAIHALALLGSGDIEAARTQFAATLASGRALQLLTVQVRCLTGQGLVALAVRDDAAAAAAFNAAVALFEDQRRTLPGDDLRGAFLTDHLRPYQELLRLALRADTNTSSPHTAASVLQQLERVRAWSLGARVDQRASATERTADREQRERLNWLYLRVRRLEEEGEPTAALSDEMRRIEGALLERARRARLTAPATAPGAQAEAGELLDVEQLQRALGDEDALVEYGVADGELFACVVTRVGVHLHRALARWNDVAEAVRAARFQLETLRHGATPVRDHLDTLTARTQRRLRQLHDLLWAPLLPSIGHYRRVIVVPHAQLGLLPFAALHDGAQSLGQRYALAVAPSARVALHGLARHLASPAQALVLGDPAGLPHAATEAGRIAGMFARSTLLTGASATLDQLFAHAPAADVLHLACHGRFRSDNPMFSALQLADGALTVDLVETLTLRPATVVLSACETGVAAHGSGSEMLGLVRAFLIAGSARVVGSLWPVDDAATGGFMAEFYEALVRGSSPAFAMQRAQAEMMARRPHPYYWAAFTLFGGW